MKMEKNLSTPNFTGENGFLNEEMADKIEFISFTSKRSYFKHPKKMLQACALKSHMIFSKMCPFYMK